MYNNELADAMQLNLDPCVISTYIMYDKMGSEDGFMYALS